MCAVLGRVQILLSEAVASGREAGTFLKYGIALMTEDAYF